MQIHRSPPPCKKQALLFFVAYLNNNAGPNSGVFERCGIDLWVNLEDTGIRAHLRRYDASHRGADEIEIMPGAAQEVAEALHVVNRCRRNVDAPFFNELPQVRKHKLHDVGGLWHVNVQH